MLSKAHSDDELEEYFVPNGMHGLQKEGRWTEVEMLMVLSKCLWVLYAGSDIDTGTGFEDLLGESGEEG